MNDTALVSKPTQESVTLPRFWLWVLLASRAIMKPAFMAPFILTTVVFFIGSGAACLRTFLFALLFGLSWLAGVVLLTARAMVTDGVFQQYVELLACTKFGRFLILKFGEKNGT